MEKFTNILNRMKLHMEKYKEETLKIEKSSLKPAAVLVPLFEHEEELFVLLTKRTDKVGSHQGDVCFPGGKQDDTDDNIVATALRETWEEIGLKPSQVEVLGAMFPTVSYTRLLVTPVIGFIKDVQDVKLNINTDEVDDIFACRLDFFLDSSSHKYVQSKITPGLYLHLFKFNSQPQSDTGCDFIAKVFNPKHNKHLIYGLTAHMAILAALVCLDKKSGYNIAGGDTPLTQDSYMGFQIKYLNHRIIAFTKQKSTTLNYKL
uniref:peroxisomal coenzyme A diphosphatase NUDT7 n=1 Tax=Ciona intestinalis TaxID=7719 RepID=UPI000180CD8E|nr:peroxisomal coenzyme A diphosphatase NUDT7 [Ciona intestinalis]|eukprot:XP_002129842.1 peroxisomal coenzyme A diphosphatase NUDT7 [Ciona intestinalis]